jgi:hypothetical protein
MNLIRLQQTAGVFLFVVLAAGASRATAQEPAGPPNAQAGARRGGGQFAGMQRINGEVTAVSGATITIKTEDGATMQVVTTDNTRVMKGRGLPGQGGAGLGATGQSGQGQGRFDTTLVKVSDLKVGDGVMAAGNLDAPNKTIHAAFVVATDAATVKALKDNLGKTYITGKVTAIDLDDAKMTVERPDHVSQTIAFDETTSFKRGRGMRAGGVTGADPAARSAESGDSITLGDIKVGDNVTGQGVVKAGTFVPAQLMVSTPGQGGPRRGAAATQGTTQAPGSGPGLN